MWLDGIKHDDVLLFISNTALCIRWKVVKYWVLYTRKYYLYVTCVALGWHRLDKGAKGQFNFVKKSIALTEDMFKKAPSRLNVFQLHASDLFFAAVYCCAHFENICNILDLFDSDEALKTQTSIFHNRMFKTI